MPDHADLHAVRERARRAAVAREDRDAVADRVVIAQPQRFVHGVHAHDAEHRSEDLIVIDAHLRRHAVEHRAAQEEPVAPAVLARRAPVDDELRAFLDAEIDVRPHLRVVLAGDQRPHLDARRRSRADAQFAHALAQPLDQRVRRRVADRDRDRDRHAALAGRTERGAHQCVDRHVQVGVRHHDEMVLRAAQRLNALAVARPGL